MGSIPIVTFLLEAGADVTIANRRGLTPLQVAAGGISLHNKDPLVFTSKVIFS